MSETVITPAGNGRVYALAMQAVNIEYLPALNSWAVTLAPGVTTLTRWRQWCSGDETALQTIARRRHGWRKTGVAEVAYTHVLRLPVQQWKEAA